VDGKLERSTRDDSIATIFVAYQQRNRRRHKFRQASPIDLRVGPIAHLLKTRAALRGLSNPRKRTAFQNRLSRS